MFVEKDEGICFNLSVEKLGMFKIVFKEDGIVIVGNVLIINDGVFVLIIVL